MKTRRKILIVGILAVFLMSAMTAVAYFYDSVLVEDNKVEAATLYLSGDEGEIVPFNITDMVPGDSEKTSMNITNNGTIDGNLTARIIAISDPENEVLPPELKAGDAVGVDLGGDAWSGKGELDNLINLEFEVDGTVLGSGGIQTGDLFNYTLGPGETVQLNMTVSWPTSTVDNTAQSDSVEFDLELVLMQIIA